MLSSAERSMVLTETCNHIDAVFKNLAGFASRKMSLFIHITIWHAACDHQIDHPRHHGHVHRGHARHGRGRL